MKYTHPRFAVVGHPNKGKSSIVSTLAMDDSVHISDTPGTTTKKRSFPLTVDGKVLYELFDTPGFQRARKVLAWLKEHDVSADKKHKVVQAFIDAHKEDTRYQDEIELLEPIMEGAGIIYIVDGSKPYGEEYEAEMEILRWTGQPSMALINHIDVTDYSQEWKRALGQYFSSVRTFNPMQASMTQHIRILESMSQLNEEWIAPVKASIKLFERYHEQMLDRSASIITQLIYTSLSYTERLGLKEEDATEEEKETILKRYQIELRRYEREAQKKIENIWNHEHLEKIQESLLFEGMDLFSKESASIFGLTRKELLLTGATGGAVTGAGVDLLFGGSTLLLGSAIGALLGGSSAFFGFNELSEVKVLGQSLGKKYLEMGPVKNVNFPYILLNRALCHASEVANRAHALRSVAKFDMGVSFREQWMEETTKKSLEKLHSRFRADSEVKQEELQEYEALIKSALKRLVDI